MLTRRNYCGRVQSTASCRWAARVCRYRLAQTLSQRRITFSCLALPSLLILAWTNMFPAYVHHVSSGYGNFDEFDDHWMISLWITLVHAFVTAWVDYCNMVVAPSPRSVIDKLQRVLNAAARLVSGTRKYDRGLSQILHADLHWLDVADPVQYKLGVTVHRCLHNKAPQYLVDCCFPVSDITSRQRIHFARHCLKTIPHHRRSTLSRQAFLVAEPTVWNLLPDQLRDFNCTEFAFRQSLKIFFFNQY